MALTTIGIAKLKPKKADYRVADGGGLYVLVRPNGSKLWRYDYRLNAHDLFSHSNHPLTT